MSDRKILPDLPEGGPYNASFTPPKGALEVDSIYPWYNKKIDAQDAELTRLRGEVERKGVEIDMLRDMLSSYHNRAETAEARVRELENSTRSDNELIIKLTNELQYIVGIVEKGTGKKPSPETTTAQAILNYVKSLESQLARLNGLLSEWKATASTLNDKANITIAKAETAEARVKDRESQLAELRARKPLGLEDCKVIALDLQKISESISQNAPAQFRNRQEAEEWYEKTKGIEVEAHAQAIHDALPPAPKRLSVEKIVDLLWVNSADVQTDETGEGFVNAITCSKYKAVAQAIHQAIYGGEE